MSAARSEPEETWGWLVERFGEPLARLIVEVLDGDRPPRREWLRRLDARARFEAKQLPPGLSRRRRAGLLGIDESTLRQWEAEEPQESEEVRGGPADTPHAMCHPARVSSKPARKSRETEAA